MDNFDNTDLPVGWVATDLNEIIAPRREKGSPCQYPDLPFIGMEHVEAHTMKILGTVPSGTMRSNANRYYSGDVLYGRLRPYLNKVCMPGSEGFCSAEFIVFPKNDSIDTSFLKYRLNAHDFCSFASHLNAGDRPRVDFEQLGSFKIPLPPFPEQKRIVAKIEELFSELDKGIESFKTAREQLKVYRQALLKHAFEGKLTAAWRQENQDKLEPADALLKRIQTERAERYRQQVKEWEKAVKAWEKSGKQGSKPGKPSKPKELPPLSAEELAELPKLPMGWGWVRLSYLSEKIQIGPFGSLLHQEDYIVGGTPLINPSHIKGQRISPDYNLTVSSKKLAELKNYIMKFGDVVLGRRGEMGRCAVISGNESGWLCGTGSLFVRLLPSFNPDFACEILGSQRVRAYLSSSSIGTTMQNLNKRILHDLPIQLCSPKEQSMVIQILEEQFSSLENLDQTITTALQQAETLRQSILKKAFSGQLVPQDPNDEPASVLLARIKAERAAVGARSKHARNKRQETTSTTGGSRTAPLQKPRKIRTKATS